MCTTIYIHVYIVNERIYCVFILGDITISGGISFTLDSDLNGASPQFTLTCISTGGPAATVTWTRGSIPACGDVMTVFNGNTTAPQYTHTLTVTGGSGMGGDYTCTVANTKPSEDSATYIVQGARQYVKYTLPMFAFVHRVQLPYTCVEGNHVYAVNGCV